MAMEPSEVLDLFKRCCLPTAVISKTDRIKAQTLCEVTKAFLWARAHGLVEQAHGRPILYTYASDGTPALLTGRVVGGVALRRRFVRKHKSGIELLVERAMLKTTNSSGQPIMACLMSDPTPMGNGKTAWHHVDACIKYFPLLRQCGHTGICVQHYSWDRAVFGPAARSVEGYHALQYEAMRADEPEGTADLLEQMDWYVSTGCASHDCQKCIGMGHG